MNIYKNLFLVTFLFFVGCSGKSIDNSVLDADEKIEKRIEDFQKCHKMALRQKKKTDADPYGTLKLGFTINPKGKVTESNVLSNLTGSRILETCSKKVLSSIQFNKNTQGNMTQSTYTLHFHKEE